jgi:putative chitinase
MRLDVETLVTIMPGCEHPATWIKPLEEAMNKCGIRDKDSIAAFLAQIAVESGELNRLEENLSYSPQRICAVWPKRFPALKDALPYARNPQKLGNMVYANRLGNGDYDSGDGYRYRGRGLIQVTGRANYERIGKALGIPLVEVPDMLLEPRWAAMSAAQFWAEKNLNFLAFDAVDDDDEEDFEKITKTINGGLHGQPERERFWERAKEALARAE